MRLHTLPNGKTAARYPAAVYEWRSQVQQAVAEAQYPTIVGPVELRLGFEMPHLTSHYLPVNSKRSVPELRDGIPPPTVAPDLDKLVRCVCDAITDAGLWRDDAQVVTLHAAKRYGRIPGVRITVIEL